MAVFSKQISKKYDLPQNTVRIFAPSMELVDFRSYIELYRLYRKSLLFQYICLTCYNFAPTYVYFCFFYGIKIRELSFF